MSLVEVDTPILCSPFAQPAERWRIEERVTPERREGRRPAGYWYRDPKAPEPEEGFTRGAWQPLFFAQVEAAETIVFLAEARSDFLQGHRGPGGAGWDVPTGRGEDGDGLGQDDRDGDLGCLVDPQQGAGEGRCALLGCRAWRLSELARYEIVHEMASAGALIDGEATSTTAVPQV